MNKYDINRYIIAQDNSYKDAKEELINEKKISHWMWYIFPQLKGLGFSYNSEYYGLANIEETKLYLNNKILKDRMYELCNILLESKSCDPINIFGVVDAKKLMSSMTLFYIASNEQIFLNILNKFFNGELDKTTVNLLNK